MLVLYHGSDKVVTTPQYGKGERTNDYGQGFYLTEHPELAAEWACPREGVDGVINRYELSLDSMNVLDLDQQPFEHWISILVQHRNNDMGTAARERMGRFVAMYPYSVAEYDIVKGWRADDSYYAFIRAFFNAALSLENLSKAMYLGDYGTQYCLLSRRSFESIRYTSHEEVSADEYFAKREERDRQAKSLFLEMPNKASGTLIIDIVGRD